MPKLQVIKAKIDKFKRHFCASKDTKESEMTSLAWCNTCNLNTFKAEIGGQPGLYRIQGLLCKTQFQKQTNKKNKKQTEVQ